MAAYSALVLVVQCRFAILCLCWRCGGGWICGLEKLLKFERIQPGMVLYDVGRTKMGNTTMSTISVWSVRIISVDADTRSAMVSWNTNKPTRYYEHSPKRLKEKQPMLIKIGFGHRLATREEQKAMKVPS
jgi:hypothetical protein